MGTIPLLVFGVALLAASAAAGCASLGSEGSQVDQLQQVEWEEGLYAVTYERELRREGDDEALSRECEFYFEITESSDGEVQVRQKGLLPDTEPPIEDHLQFITLYNRFECVVPDFRVGQPITSSEASAEELSEQLEARIATYYDESRYPFGTGVGHASMRRFHVAYLQESARWWTDFLSAALLAHADGAVQIQSGNCPGDADATCRIVSLTSHNAHIRGEWLWLAGSDSAVREMPVTSQLRLGFRNDQRMPMIADRHMEADGAEITEQISIERIDRHEAQRVEAAAQSLPEADKHWVSDNYFGFIDKRAIDRMICDRSEELQACFTDRLCDKRDSSITIKLAWRIESDGLVSNVEIAESNADDPALESCVKDRVEEFVFPRPHMGRIDLTYPLKFKAQTDEDREAAEAE